MNKMIFFILCCFVSHLGADPWGKDADLATKGCGKKSIPTSSSNTCLSGIGQKLIKFHQTVISPADGPRSHYYPCSSQYAINAMRKYGFFQGVMMGCDRLMRENNDDWVYRYTKDCEGKAIKYDPVP